MKKNKKKIKKIWCMIAMVGIAILFMPEFTDATDNGDVDVQAWFTWMQDNGKWHEWVDCTNWSDVKDILGSNVLTLKIGQPVKCRFNIVPHADCAVDFFVMEPGGVNAYDVLKGNKQERTVSHSPVYANIEITYNWTLAPNGNWTGTGPINLYWEVNFATYEHVEKHEVSGYIVFANPMIINKQWTGPTDDNGNDDGGTPGFESVAFAVSLLFVIGATYYSKRKKRK